MFDPAAVRWNWLAAPVTGWLSVAYLGWIATILAYAMWTGLLKRHAGQPRRTVQPGRAGGGLERWHAVAG
jgi:hypothetical protein